MELLSIIRPLTGPTRSRPGEACIATNQIESPMGVDDCGSSKKTHNLNEPEGSLLEAEKYNFVK